MHRVSSALVHGAARRSVSRAVLKQGLVRCSILAHGTRGLSFPTASGFHETEQEIARVCSATHAYVPVGRCGHVCQCAPGTEPKRHSATTKIETRTGIK